MTNGVRALPGPVHRPVCQLKTFWPHGFATVVSTRRIAGTITKPGLGFPDAIKGGGYFTTPMPARANTCCGF
jgi:hypothetical protein